MILIQFFDPFWHKPMHHNQSKLLFPFIYSRSFYFISAAFSQSVTTFHLLQQNSKMEKYLIEISFFLFRLVEMFEICSRTSVMATTYCHCSKCSRAKYWYVLFFSNFSCMFLKLHIFFLIWIFFSDLNSNLSYLRNLHERILLPKIVDLSLFEQIALVISNFFEMFSITRTIFSHSRSEQFW